MIFTFYLALNELDASNVCTYIIILKWRFWPDPKVTLYLIHCQHCGSTIQQGLNHGGQAIPGSNVEGPEI